MEKLQHCILWVDDEIELLQPHIMLLEQRGYKVLTSTNGTDAIDILKKNKVDLIFLDEMMVGMTGLETLVAIRAFDSNIPVVMATKNETESLMEEAIGHKINDYLTKPINPTQVLMACKKFLDAERIGKEKFTQNYLSGFSQLSSQMLMPLNWKEWKEVYNKLVNWSVELDKIKDSGLQETLRGKWRECNLEFSKFVESNYIKWLAHKDNERDDNNPIMSPHILDYFLKPTLKVQKENIYLIVIDCLRFDQWMVLREMLASYYTFDTNLYCSILPTATPYARNSLFAGLYPIDIKKYYPQYWAVENNSEDHKQNAYEKELFEAWLKRNRFEHGNKYSFIKIFDTDFGKKIEREFEKYMQNNITAIVINAVDMIAHSRSDHAILKEIAPDEAAYRSLTRSWFMYSSLFNILKTISTQKDAKVFITTDHGSIRCLRGVKVLGDKDTSTNLRYKFGKNVNSDKKAALQMTDPILFKIPSSGITVSNVFAKEDYYFVYPTDYHQYMAKFRDSFQHGGISLEEMVIPFIKLEPK